MHAPTCHPCLAQTCVAASQGLQKLPGKKSVCSGRVPGTPEIAYNIQTGRRKVWDTRLCLCRPSIVLMHIFYTVI